MPATSINLYHMQDAKNNFEALRPAPVCLENNMLVDQCQSVHVSTNCYYGYHDQKAFRKAATDVDCEMMEAPHGATSNPSPQSNARKRSAEESLYPKNKRLREDESSICSLVGTRSSPSHSASAFNTKIPQYYIPYFTYWINKLTVKFIIV